MKFVIFDVHRASYAKHLKSKYHLINEEQSEIFLPDWLFHEPIDNKIKKIFNPKPLRQRARDNIKLYDKQLNEELAKKMINPFYFTDTNLKVGFKITLGSHHFNHANSKLAITPNYIEFGIEVRHIDKIIKELSVIYARLIIQ